MSFVDTVKIEALTRELLEAIGEDTKREGLLDTPRRVANYYREFFEYDPGKVDVTFESVVVDQMVVVTGIEIFSLCEHHMLPFTCKISIGYIAGNKVIGLSKLARIAQRHAHKLQIQERLARDIADEVSRICLTPDVAVLIEGVHLCMVMRGVKTKGTMITSVMRGAFKDRDKVRAEFLTLTRRD